jgi:hypothetical protein
MRANGVQAWTRPQGDPGVNPIPGMEALEGEGSLGGGRISLLGGSVISSGFLLGETK